MRFRDEKAFCCFSGRSARSHAAVLTAQKAGGAENKRTFPSALCVPGSNGLVRMIFRGMEKPDWFFHTPLHSGGYISCSTAF